MAQKRKRPTQGGALKGFGSAEHTDKANTNHSDGNQAMSELYNYTFSLSPKETRILAALLAGTQSRLELDGIGNTVNSPEYVSRLRERGLVISTERFEVTTLDGVAYPGRYHLHPESHELARKLLQGEKK